MYELVFAQEGLEVLKLWRASLALEKELAKNCYCFSMKTWLFSFAFDFAKELSL